MGRYLRDLGCLLIEMDQLGREVQQPGGEAYVRITEEFGPTVLQPNGEIDRRKLAAEVFGDSARLEVLNRIVHPLVRARAARLEAAFFAESPHGIAVTEAAILIETGSYRDFDKLILAVCRPEQQLERAMERDGLSRQEVLSRLARQMPLEEKMKYADYLIDTSLSREHTLAQADAVYEHMRSLSR